MAENTAFIQGFLRGVISPENYLRLITDLHLIYQAMESALESHRDTPGVGSFWRAELVRVPSLAQDLTYFQNTYDIELPEPSVSAERYACHLSYLESREPMLLIAHCYTRYLGDLSGGQILGQTVKRALNLPTDSGTAFYHFPQISALAPYKQRFKSALDELPLSEAAIEAQVKEAIYAFRLNIDLFEELKGNPWPALWRTAWRSLLGRRSA